MKISSILLGSSIHPLSKVVCSQQKKLKQRIQLEYFFFQNGGQDDYQLSSVYSDSAGHLMDQGDDLTEYDVEEVQIKRIANNKGDDKKNNKSVDLESIQISNKGSISIIDSSRINQPDQNRVILN